MLIRRYGSAALAEKAMLAALEILSIRIPKMSDNMLIRTIETLSQIGAERTACQDGMRSENPESRAGRPAPLTAFGSPITKQPHKGRKGA